MNSTHFVSFLKYRWMGPMSIAFADTPSPDAPVAKFAQLTPLRFLTTPGLWLGLVARTFYRRHLGALMAERPNWTAAVAFYLLYVVGVTVSNSTNPFYVAESRTAEATAQAYRSL